MISKACYMSSCQTLLFAERENSISFCLFPCFPCEISLSKEEHVFWKFFFRALGTISITPLILFSHCKNVSVSWLFLKPTGFLHAPIAALGNSRDFCVSKGWAGLVLFVSVS